MANIALNTVYNHYLTTYSKTQPSSYDTHKKSELKKVYNSIIKLNKDAPLSIIDDSKEAKSFAIGLKEDARALRNTIASLGGLDEESLLKKKVAYSSNSDMVSVEFQGQDINSTHVPTLELQVHQLASPQVTIGKFVRPDIASGLVADTYSFDINVNDYTYEFQFGISKGESNKSIIDRLNRLINNSNIGISSSILENDDGQIALKIESNATGLPANKTQVFAISDNKTSLRSGIVRHLDIGEITRAAQNAQFTINGEERNSTSNQFMVDKIYLLHLNNLGSTPDETVTIGIKDDMESLAENVNTLVGGYNQFLQSAIDYSETHKKSNYLIRDMQHITANYMKAFADYGITRSENGTLSMDRETFINTVQSGDKYELLSTIKDFTNTTLRKANKVSLNPMDYVDRKIVAYKNPGKNFAAPYITSAYSGMLFNGYC